MSAGVAGLRESLTAKAAGVWFLAGVGAHVNGEITRIREGAAAVDFFTLVGLLPGVGAHVRGMILSSARLLPALPAAVLPSTSVNVVPILPGVGALMPGVICLVPRLLAAVSAAVLPSTSINVVLPILLGLGRLAFRPLLPWHRRLHGAAAEDTKVALLVATRRVRIF